MKTVYHKMVRIELDSYTVIYTESYYTNVAKQQLVGDNHNIALFLPVGITDNFTFQMRALFRGIRGTAIISGSPERV